MTRMIKTKQLVKTNELPYRFYMAKNSHQLFIQQKGNSLLVFMNENNMKMNSCDQLKEVVEYYNSLPWSHLCWKFVYWFIFVALKYNPCLRSKMTDLEEKIENLHIEELIKPLNELQSCRICPHNCNADRFSRKLGYCKADASFSVSSVVIHKGEEPVICGSKGICNVFFSRCNLSCIYCCIIFLN